MPTNQTAVLVVPAARLAAANGFLNCVEPSLPTSPIFVLDYRRASPPNTEFALMQPSYEDFRLTALVTAIAESTIGRPPWDLQNVIDIPGVAGMLASAVHYEFDPADESIMLPPAQVWMGSGFSLSQVIQLGGLEPLPPA